jgi:DNA-binding LacI/PurR family transcriptional regulator
VTASTRTAPTVPTLEDVARAAGVSRATVSRVINGGALVSTKAREAVDEAVARLGYAPNLAARSLVTRRSGVVGVLVPETDLRVFSDPFFASAFRGAMDAFADEDTHVILAMSKSGEPSERLLDHLVSRRVDGAVILSHHGTRLARAAARLPAPVAFVGDPDVPGLPFVDLDQVRAARLATQRLLDRGCTRIATVTGPLDMPAGAGRRQGFVDALRGAGRRAVAALPGDFTLEGGAAAADLLLATHPDVDGIFVASDLMAAGVVQALLRAGRRVPDDVAVVGFDDAVIARQTVPALTTMTNPAHELARRAALMVRTMLDGGSRPEPVVLQSELVVRESA